MRVSCLLVLLNLTSACALLSLPQRLRVRRSPPVMAHDSWYDGGERIDSVESWYDSGKRLTENATQLSLTIEEAESVIRQLQNSNRGLMNVLEEAKVEIERIEKDSDRARNEMIDEWNQLAREYNSTRETVGELQRELESARESKEMLASATLSLEAARSEQISGLTEDNERLTRELQNKLASEQSVARDLQSRLSAARSLQKDTLLTLEASEALLGRFMQRSLLGLVWFAVKRDARRVGSFIARPFRRGREALGERGSQSSASRGAPRSVDGFRILPYGFNKERV